MAKFLPLMNGRCSQLLAILLDFWLFLWSINMCVSVLFQNQAGNDDNVEGHASMNEWVLLSALYFGVATSLCAFNIRLATMLIWMAKISVMNGCCSQLRGCFFGLSINVCAFSSRLATTMAGWTSSMSLFCPHLFMSCSTCMCILLVSGWPHAVRFYARSCLLLSCFLGLSIVCMLLESGWLQ